MTQRLDTVIRGRDEDGTHYLQLHGRGSGYSWVYSVMEATLLDHREAARMARRLAKEHRSPFRRWRLYGIRAHTLESPPTAAERAEYRRRAEQEEALMDAIARGTAPCGGGLSVYDVDGPTGWDGDMHENDTHHGASWR